MSNSATPWTIDPTRLLHSWNFLGKSTGVGCHFLSHGIFLTQGSNPGLPHCGQTLYPLRHQGIPQNNLYLHIIGLQFSLVSHPVRLFATPWITACQASLSITNSWSLFKPMSIESMMPSNHLILCPPLLLLPPILPLIRG